MRSAMSDLYPEPEADTEEVLMTASLPSTSSGRTGGPVRATASVTGKPSVSSKSSISSIIRSGVSAVSSLFTTQKRSGEMSRPKSASPKAKRTPPRPPRPKAGRSVQTTASQTSATASENDTPEEAESEEVVSTSEPQPAPLVEQPAGERRRASSRPRGEDLDSEGRSVASESGSHTDTETADAEERGSLASEGFASSLDGDPGSPQDFSSVASSAVSDAEDTTGDDEGYVLSPRGSRRVTFDKNAPDTLVFTPDDHGRTSDDEAVRENRERLAGVGAEGHRPSANENFLQLLALLKERSLTPTSEQLGEFASPSEPTSHVARFLKDLETRRNSREADSSDITEDEEPSHREDRRFAFPSERPSDRRGSFVDTIDEFLHYLEAIAEDHKAHEEAMEMLHNEPQKASATETDSDTASEGGDSVWSDSNSRASDDSDTHASMGNESSSELASVETDADSGLASSPRTEQTSGEDAAPAEDAGDNGKNNELGGRSHDQAPSPGQFELPFDADPDEILAAPGKGAEQPPDTVLMAVSEASQETSPKSDSTMSHGEAQDRSSEEGHGSISNMTTEEDKSEENEANSRIQEKHIPEPDEAIVQSEKLTEENVEINPTPLSSDSLEPETPDALVPEHHTAQQVSSPGASSLNDTMNFHRERPEGESATSELSDSSNALPVITDKTRNPTAPTFPNDTDAEHSAGLSSGTKDVNHSEIGELDTEEIPGPDDDLATLEQSSSTETIRAVNDEERADGAQYTDDIDTSHSVEVTPDLSNRTNSEPGPQETLEAARQVNNEPPPEASLETHPDESLEMHPKEATDSSLEEAPNLPPQEALELPPQEANEVSALGATHPQSQDASTPAQGVSQESNDLSADKRRGTSADQRALRGLLQSSLPQMPAVQVLGTQSADALAERRSLTVATETSDGSLLSVPSSDIQARSPGQVGSLEVVAKSPGEVSQLPSEAPSESELPQHEPVRSLASIADRLLREGSDEEVQAAPSGMGQANSLAAISGQLLTDHSPGELAEPPSAGDEADEERELSTVMMDDGVRPGTTKADAGAEEQSGPSKASAAIGVEDQRRDGGAAAALGVEDQPRDGGAAATLGVEDQPKDGGVVAALGVEDQPGNDRTTVILGLGDQPGDGEASLGPGLSDRPEDGEEAADPETEDQPEESEAAAAIGMERQPRDGDAVARLLREKGDESLKQAIAPIMTSGQRDGDEYETSEASETAESAIDDQKAHEEAMLMLESETQGTLTSEAIHPSTPSTDSGEEYNANQNEKVSRAKPGSDSSAAISGLEVTDPSALVSDGRMYTRQEEVMSGAREANGPVEETDEDMTKRSTDKQAANLTPESTHGTNELIAISSESSVLSDLRSDVSEYATGSEKSAFEEDRNDPVPVIDENNAPMTDHGDSTHAEETGAGLGVQGHKTSAQKMVWSLITMASGIVEQMQGSKIVISPSKIGFRNADEQTNLPAKEGSGSASKGVLSEETKSTPKVLENLPPRSMSQIVHDEITKEAKKSNISMTQLKHAYSDTINRIVADAQNQVVKAAQGLVGAVLKTSSGRLHDVQNHEDAGVENKTSSEQSGQSTNSSDHEESNSIENDDLPVSDEKSASTDTSEEVQDGSLPKHQSDVTVSRISQVKVASKTSALGGRTSAVKHSKGNLENSRIIQEDNRKTNWEPPSPQDIANIAVAITQSVLDAASRIADDENELDRKSRVKASILHLKKGNKIKVQPRPASKTAPNQRENSISNMEGDTEFPSDENQQAELPSDENEDAELPSDTVGENPDAELRADENAIPELSPGENVGAALTPDENADDNLPPDQGAVSEQSPDESADAELPPGENATEELAPDEPPDENADAEWAPDESAHVDVPTTENSNQDLSMEEKQDSGLPPDDNLASDLAPNEQTAELPSDEEVSDLPPTDSQDAALAPTESQDAALAPTESQDAALPPTESQDAALTPIESQDAALPPTESQDA
ncbi:dentin sialophosphoprotein-like, partial [Pollicipes pollicipes]|uniref:dentin sialophosphoprotein-like n=1 Tax=Pollicipes pollicipes TaxID=41117 RepID=UPI001885571C